MPIPGRSEQPRDGFLGCGSARGEPVHRDLQEDVVRLGLTDAHPDAVPGDTGTPAPAPAAVVDPTAKMVELRAAGLAAAGRRDWAGAVKSYEQIRQLPPEVWPSNLEVLISLAKQRHEQSKAAAAKPAAK